MEIQRNLAQLIASRKRESGKSLTELAAELEISRSALQDYLAGRGNPQATTIHHLARKLGVPDGSLFSEVTTSQQAEALLSLFRGLRMIDNLPPEDRRAFAELLTKMLALLSPGRKGAPHD